MIKKNIILKLCNRTQLGFLFTSHWDIIVHIWPCCKRINLYDRALFIGLYLSTNLMYLLPMLSKVHSKPNVPTRSYKLLLKYSVTDLTKYFETILT